MGHYLQNGGSAYPFQCKEHKPVEKHKFCKKEELNPATLRNTMCLSIDGISPLCEALHNCPSPLKLFIIYLFDTSSQKTA